MRFTLKFFPFFLSMNKQSFRHHLLKTIYFLLSAALCLCKKDSLAILMSYFWVPKSVVLICVSMPPPINTPLSWLQREPQNGVLWLLSPYYSFPRLLLVILVLLPFPIYFRRSSSLFNKKRFAEISYYFKYCYYFSHSVCVLLSHFIVLMIS